MLETTMKQVVIALDALRFRTRGPHKKKMLSKILLEDKISMSSLGLKKEVGPVHMECFDLCKVLPNKRIFLCVHMYIQCIYVY